MPGNSCLKCEQPVIVGPGVFGTAVALWRRSRGKWVRVGHLCHNCLDKQEGAH